MPKPPNIQTAREIATVAGFAIATIGVAAIDWRAATIIAGAVVMTAGIIGMILSR